MDLINKTVCPLHPLMCAKGSEDSYSVIRKEVFDLELNFQLITKLVSRYTEHPIASFIQGDGLHTRYLNGYQFNLLNYGFVLHAEHRLILTKAPLGTNREVYIRRHHLETLERDLNNRGAAANVSSVVRADAEENLKEHNFIVYRLSESDDGQVTPLFRLFFRNEGNTDRPLFVLKNVLVSSQHYPFVLRWQNEGPARLSDAELARRRDGILQDAVIMDLVQAYEETVEGIRPAWSELRGVQNMVADPTWLLLSYAKFEGDGETSASLSPRKLVATDEQPVSLTTKVVQTCDSYSLPFQYLHNSERLANRLLIHKRDGGLIAAWRQGLLDVSYFEEGDGSEVPMAGEAPCVRVLFRATSSGGMDLDEKELSVCSPNREEYSPPFVYTYEGEECVRVWVLKALLAAEMAHVHVLLFDVDPTLLLSHCVQLLGEDGVRDESEEASLRTLCRVIVETVEDFIQHTGEIWLVHVSFFDYYAYPSAAIAAAALKEIRAKKVADEKQYRLQQTVEEVVLQNPLAMSSVVDSSVDNLSHSSRRPSRPSTGGGSASAKRSGSLMVHTGHYRSSVTPLVVAKAERAGVHVDDDSIAHLFAILQGREDADGAAEGDAAVRATDGEVAVELLVNVLSLKLDPHTTDKVLCLLPFENPLTSLDHCGVPLDEPHIRKYVMGFRKRGAPGVRSDVAAEDAALNYAEFSMLMLSLAHI
ncbi:hypothetical protein STCU_06735 [Strigomonas culicis]|uniref:Uncharacterized protein n=1 Tax=Strigomonas culicis TaxID=28005 RepID=S9U9B2_9TRYP|nr:hypothetical protein STCU_06735 [Strigomonas culicis]|eukprot:EPY25508.1 hypothetical protein STCU_06735 [Strigomonas culicis]